MRDIFLVFNKYSISKPAFEESYEATKRNGFWNPFKQAEIVFKKIPNDLKKDVSRLLESTKDYVFDDVHNFLRSIEAEKILLSCGEKETQIAKIKNSGIDKYFESIIITSDKLKTDFFARQKIELPAIFIDDRVNTINNIKSKFPSIFCVLIKRPGTKFFKETAPIVLADITAKTLSDLFRQICEEGN